MPIYTPDLTGLDWGYYFSTYQRTIFRYAQKMPFVVPVFQNERLELIKLGTVNTPMVVNVDYIIYDDDIDYDAMSVCKTIDNDFSAILLKSVTILAYTDETFMVQAKFNQLYADNINYARINSAQELEVTPALISNMVEQLTYLQQMVVDRAGEFTEQSSIVKMALEEYLNGNALNDVIDEIHDVNTLGGNSLIRPIYGAFFKDSVVVKNALSGVEFVPDTDYKVIDLDITRTRATSNTSGVYRVIEILKDTVGEVKISYRAYGGEADVASMRQVQDRINVIEDYLSRTSYLTPQTLPADPAMISIINKIQEMEGTMRLLLQNGMPSYGDVSTGTAVLKRIVSQDTNLHWWSIASLYRVDGSVDDILADVFKFRMKSTISNMMFECSVSVNVNTDAAKRLDVKCLNSNIPANTLAVFVPKLRIIEVNTGGVYSGVQLQLGMKLSAGILQETFDIEDMSGRESCWKLVPFSEISTPAEDTGVLMPNGVAVYTTGDPTAIANETIIPFTDGLNLLSATANIPLTIGTIATPIVTHNFSFVVPNIDQIDYDNVKGFLVDATVMIGTGSERVISFVVPINSRDADNQRLYGYTETVTSDANYSVGVLLWYSSGDSSFEFDYRVGSSNQGITLNVTATKLMF